MPEVEYRDAALKKLSSPDQLDQLLRVTSPRGWLAVAALAMLLAGVLAWLFFGTLPTTVQGQGILMRIGTMHRVSTLPSGILLDIPVKFGEKIAADQVVAHIQIDSPEAGGKSANVVEIRSPHSGVVVKKLSREGDFVQPGSTLVVLEPIDGSLEVISFMALAQAKAIRPGMTVEISPSTAPRESYGFLLGHVRRVADFPSEETSMLDTLQNEELVKYFLGSSTSTQVVPLEIVVELLADPSTPSGYAWSSGQGPPFKLRAETLATATFVLDRERPINMLIPQSGP